MQSVENEESWGTYGHSRPLQIAPFDRATEIIFTSVYSVPQTH